MDGLCFAQVTLISLLLVSSWITFNKHFCRWRCFSFYWLGKQEFGKFTNGIPVIGGPTRPNPQSFHPSSCSWLVPFRWNYIAYCILISILHSDILHIPSLPLLSSLSVNLQLMCSQANPQIQLHSCHHGSPHMTLKVIFHKVKGNFLKNFYSSQHDILLLVFLWALVFIKNNILYHQTKAFKQYHVKQTKFCFSKRLNNHPYGTSAPWLSTCTSKQRVWDFS